MQMKIHQFCPSSSYGDAVTNSMLYTQSLLKTLGYEAEIYVGGVAIELKKKLRGFHKLKMQDNDILLVHHAIGHDYFEWLSKLPGRKVIVYHNITPAHFFSPESKTYQYIHIGLTQLRSYVEAGMSSAIAMSDFSKVDLEAAGYKHFKTIPLLVDLEELKAKSWNQKLVEVESRIPTFLFVGRVVSNKCQHELIQIARVLRAMLDQPFQLVLVGGYHESDSYYQSLQKEIATHGLSDWVRFTGKISEHDLYAWYRAADCFICLSEHEGFGVPLLEAMVFDVPVIAYDATNVPHLVNDAGLVLKEKNISAIAALVKLVIEDTQLKNTLVQAQRERVKQFTREKLLKDLSEFLQAFHVSSSTNACASSYLFTDRKNILKQTF